MLIVNIIPQFHIRTKQSDLLFYTVLFCLRLFSLMVLDGYMWQILSLKPQEQVANPSAVHIFRSQTLSIKSQNYIVHRKTKEQAPYLIQTNTTCTRKQNGKRWMLLFPLLLLLPQLLPLPLLVAFTANAAEVVIVLSSPAGLLHPLFTTPLYWEVHSLNSLSSLISWQEKAHTNTYINM